MEKANGFEPFTLKAFFREIGGQSSHPVKKNARQVLRTEPTLPYLSRFCQGPAKLPSAATSAGHPAAQGHPHSPSGPLHIKVRHLPVAGRLANDEGLR